MGNAAKLDGIGTEHDEPKNPPHARSIAAGSSSVFFDGKAARSDDPIDCGGVLIGGGTVNFG